MQSTIVNQKTIKNRVFGCKMCCFSRFLIRFVISQTCPCNITAIFHACKNDNFQMKTFDIFLIFAQNIDCGYTLEPPQLGGSNEYPQSMF